MAGFSTGVWFSCCGASSARLGLPADSFQVDLPNPIIIAQTGVAKIASTVWPAPAPSFRFMLCKAIIIT